MIPSVATTITPIAARRLTVCATQPRSGGHGMPQMLKFGYASATTMVTSTDGSSSRARREALIPASLPPMTSKCATYAPHTRRDRARGWSLLARRLEPNVPSANSFGLVPK